MIRHIIIWDYHDSFTKEENIENAKKVKIGLEGLKDKIAGIVEMKVIINPLSSSNGDVMLSSLFENESSLLAYQAHKEHIVVSDFVKSVTTNRRCFDYHE